MDYKQLLFICIFLVLMSSCQDHTQAKEKSIMFMGNFSGEPIQIVLTQVNDSEVHGKSQHKGVLSPMEGTRKPSTKGYKYSMKEMGSSAFEGVFQFELDTCKDLLMGVWTPIDTQHKFTVQYTLRRVNQLCQK